MASNVICSLRAEKERKMETKEKIRKYYEKPRITKVKLEIEEAILAACKNPSVTGTGQVGCRSGTSACKSIWTGS